MSTHRAGSRLVVLLLAGLGMAAAQALTVPEWQRLLKAGSAPSLVFQETRESPWLSAPLASRGTLHSSPGLLEKRVVAPRPETWRLKADRMEWLGPDGVASRQVLFSDAPAVAALANALRLIVAGDLAALEADFRIELQGDERQWTARLQPRSAAVGRHLDHLDLQGEAVGLQVIIVVEPQGERTTTRLQRGLQR